MGPDKINNMTDLESRKKEEEKFHDLVRDRELEKNQEKLGYLTSNRKFYSVTRKSVEFINSFIVKNGKGKRVLDYCCGNGDFTIFLAKNGADAYGIDISGVSIENAKETARKQGILEKVHFLAGDAENTGFEDNFFDLIVCNGVLHHLDLKKAYPELARILKPDGIVMCDEPLMHNPVFQLYRKKTPQLRTEWETEHILKKSDIKMAEQYFNKVEKRFLHLLTLLAVPFRNTRVFMPLLSILERSDLIILKIPGIKWWAWQIIFVLSDPKK